MSVYGKHQYVIGDEVFITGIDGVEGGLFEGKFAVQKIQASHGTSKRQTGAIGRRRGAPKRSGEEVHPRFISMSTQTPCGRT